MSLAPLPHVFPFRFVETVRSPFTNDGAGSVRAVVSSDARAIRHLTFVPLPLAIEMMAQAALLLQGGDPATGRKGFLAGIGGARLLAAIRPGDELDIRVRMTARLGPVARFSASIWSGPRLVARSELSVKSG